MVDGLLWEQEDVGSTPTTRIGEINISNNSKYIMSLISQRDRKVVIEALEALALEASNTEYYLGTPKYSSSEINALLNWVKLEYYKHEN